MSEWANILTAQGLRLRKTFRETEDHGVYLAEGEGIRVCRIYRHPATAYAALVGEENDALPTVYRYNETEDGAVIVEEEYVDGANLSELLEVYRPDDSQTVAIVRRLCGDLNLLHRKGFIHRDIKPENILVTSAGRVVLLDLDAASAQAPEKDRDTRLLGTVRPANRKYTDTGLSATSTYSYYVEAFDAQNNTSAKSVKNVIVTDAMFPDLKGNIGTLASGAAKEFKLDYVVDAKDISPGEVYNEAVVSYTGADGKLKTALASVTAKTGMATDGLLLYKFAAGKPANGKFYLPGEEVKFTIILLNLTSKTFKNVKLYDWLSSKKTPFQTESAIGPYSSCTYEFKTKVTWLQAKHGKLINVVSAYYTDPDTGKTASVVRAKSRMMVNLTSSPGR